MQVPRFRLIARAACATAVIAAAAAPVAEGSTVSYINAPDRGLQITAAADETNSMDVSLSCIGIESSFSCTYRVQETAPPKLVTAGQNCSQLPSGEVVECEIAGGSRVLRANLGDRADELRLSRGASNVTPGWDTFVFLGPGDDSFQAADDGTLDNVAGEAGNDVLIGGTENDRLDGGDGNDGINAGAGADNQIGGAGNDTFGMVGPDGGDRVDAGVGRDKVNYQNYTANVSVTPDGSANDGGPSEGDNVTDVEDLVGGEGNDRLTTVLAAANSDIQGRGGDDTILGSNGIDVINGGAGNDTIDGLAGNDTIDAFAGDDVANGEGGNDNIRGNAGRDTLDGGEGNDTLTTDEADQLVTSSNPFTRAGNDGAFGGAGNDTIRLGQGDDVAEGGAGDDLIEGGAGADEIFGATGNDRIFGGRQNAPQDGDGNDRLQGNSGNDTIDGALGSDTMNGSTGSDTLLARDGVADTLSCGSDASQGSGPQFAFAAPEADSATVDLRDNDPGDCETFDDTPRVSTPTVKIATKRLTVSGGRAPVLLRCPLKARRCTGVLVARLARKAKTKVPRTHSAGATRYSILGGRSRVVRVALTAADLRLLRSRPGRFGNLRVTSLEHRKTRTQTLRARVRR